MSVCNYRLLRAVASSMQRWGNFRLRKLFLDKVSTSQPSFNAVAHIGYKISEGAIIEWLRSKCNGFDWQSACQIVHQTNWFAITRHATLTTNLISQ